MSSQQQALIAEAVIGLRKAVKRKVYDSDSDSSIEHGTNRGHKLKRRARHVKEGRLAAARGHVAFRETIEHGGYQRTIIHRNPPLVDEEGYELDSDESESRIQEVMSNTADENPYASIRLEQLLTPLTAVADLPTHPSLSRPLVSQALTELALQARDLMHRENASLWKSKPLLTRLLGDLVWAPCGVMAEAEDHDLFDDETAARVLQGMGMGKRWTSGSRTAPVSHQENDHNKNNFEHLAKNQGGNGYDTARHPQPNGEPSNANGSASKSKGCDKQQGGAPLGRTNGPLDDNAEARDQDAHHRDHEALQIQPSPLSSSSSREKQPLRPIYRDDDGDVHTDGSDEPTTNAAAAAVAAAVAAAATTGNSGFDRGDVATTTTTTIDLINDDHPLPIHPLYLIPRTGRPHRDVGLPEQEVEDVRRLLQVLVQKQEEVCRGTSRLCEGLLKANRYRQTVLRWAKAEAHCGANRDMSDGEDWYDKEEWGLTEDLVKGQDEEEEEVVAQPQQKKTRNRR